MNMLYSIYTLSQQGPAKKTKLVKAGSYYLHYHFYSTVGSYLHNKSEKTTQKSLICRTHNISITSLVGKTMTSTFKVKSIMFKFCCGFIIVSVPNYKYTYNCNHQKKQLVLVSTFYLIPDQVPPPSSCHAVTSLFHYFTFCAKQKCTVRCSDCTNYRYHKQ